MGDERGCEMKKERRKSTKSDAIQCCCCIIRRVVGVSGSKKTRKDMRSWIR